MNSLAKRKIGLNLGEDNLLILLKEMLSLPL